MSVSVMTAWALYARMRVFPFVFIALQVLTISTMVIDMLTWRVLGDGTASAEYSEGKVVMRVLTAALWISYMLLSQRVRATFVNDRRAGDTNAALPAPVAAEA
jgi:hypothetical protein